mmetsp:Transcript_19702/g.22309  ORF Transcript_19702/g.22309 Transcript_19702/m.22309 type:complete len:555 (+) Transcript_19702:97-1761(+)
MNGSNTNVNTNSHRQTAPIQLPPTSNSMQFNLSSKMENNNFKPLDMQQQQQQQPSESPDKNLHLGTTSNKTNLFKKQRMNSDAAESALRAVQAFKMKTELNFPKQPQTKPAESDRFNPNFNKGNSMDMQEWMPRKSSTPSPTGMVNKRQKYPQVPGSMSMGMQNNSNSTMSQSYTSPSNESMTISPAPPHANASSSQPQDPPQPPPLQQQQQQQQQQESTQEEEQQEEQQHDLTKTLEEITRNDEEIANQENLKQQEQDKILRKLQQELNEQILLAEHGSIIKHFLDTTSHQLTFSGLLELHSYAQEGKLYVFFRNNHFATLTKHGGILYLLVTDLGYANVNDVVWEKIDDIKGDTDLFDANFCKTKAQAVHVPVGGPNLSPEQLLAQRGQSDVDYQLALELSRNDGNGQANSNALAQREGDLIAAATELSLQSYDNEQRVLSVEDTLASSQGGNLGNMKKESDKVTGTAEHNNVHNNVYTTNSTHDLLAEQMRLEKQREESDMEMAKKLQAAYNQVDRSRVSPQAAPAADESGCIRRRQPPPAAKQDSGCTIC